MEYLYLIGSVFFTSSNSICGAFYNRRNADENNSAALYSFLKLVVVFVLWAVMFACNSEFNADVIIYSVMFAACYTMCNVFLIIALKTGPVALTSLLMQLSLIAVSVWGFFFWDSSFTVLTAIGLLLVAVALFLCLYKKKTDEEHKINFKWLLFAIAAFIGNAGCSIIQKTQQMKFDGKYGGELMMIACGVSAAFCLFFWLSKTHEQSLKMIKSSGIFPLIAGVCNFLLNLFVIILATSTLSPSLIYPVIAVGGLAVTTFFSAFVFKEKMSFTQWLGVAVGAIAVGILSI